MRWCSLYIHQQSFSRLRWFLPTGEIFYLKGSKNSPCENNVCHFFPSNANQMDQPSNFYLLFWLGEKISFSFFLWLLSSQTNSNFFLLVILTRRKKIVLKTFSDFFMSIGNCLKQCQSNRSTNNGERAWSTRRLNKCDWMTISWY